jgi:mannose-6-phosphate isomerase-like protein (cupin superfamily)
LQEGREPTKRLETGLVVSDGDVNWRDWNTNSKLDGVPRYKTYFSAGETPTMGLVQGLLEYPPGTRSAAHWHTPVEVYYVLSGSGVGRIGDETLPIGPGDAVFVSSRVVHSFENTGAENLRVLWTLNCDSVDDIDFHYLD